jgi:hypothetical protein
VPANLPPQYKEAEERYRQAKATPEKILALEEMLAIIPHHKGTDKMIAQLRKRAVSAQGRMPATARWSSAITSSKTGTLLKCTYKGREAQGKNALTLARLALSRSYRRKQLLRLAEQEFTLLDPFLQNPGDLSGF